MKLKLNYFTKVVMRFMISKNNLKNFAKFKGQQMRWKSCFSKAAGFGLDLNLYKFYLNKICDFFRNCTLWNACERLFLLKVCKKEANKSNSFLLKQLLIEASHKNVVLESSAKSRGKHS